MLLMLEMLEVLQLGNMVLFVIMNLVNVVVLWRENTLDGQGRTKLVDDVQEWALHFASSQSFPIESFEKRMLFNLMEAHGPQPWFWIHPEKSLN